MSQSTPVQMVHTYTTTIPRPNRKGITCVTHHQQPHHNNENHNPNIQGGGEGLAERVRELEEQLLVAEKEKIELEKMVLEGKGKEGLVESHYMGGEEDVRRLMEERREWMERLHEYEQEKHQLNKNIHIREQYILKLQAQLDQLSHKATNQCETQTDFTLRSGVVANQQHEQIQTEYEVVGECAVQCNFLDAQLKSLLQLAEHLRQQDVEHLLTIKTLQQYLTQLEHNHSTLQTRHADLQQTHSTLTQKLEEADVDNKHLMQHLQAMEAEGEKSKVETMQLKAQTTAVGLSRDLCLQRQQEAERQLETLKVEKRRIKLLEQGWNCAQEEHRKELQQQINKVRELTDHLSFQTARGNELQDVLFASQTINKRLQLELKEKDLQLQTQHEKVRGELNQVLGHLDEQSHIITQQQLKVREEEGQLRRAREGESAEVGSIVAYHQQRVRDIQLAFDRYVGQLKKQNQENKGDKQSRGELLRKIETEQARVAELTQLKTLQQGRIDLLQTQLIAQRHQLSAIQIEKTDIQNALNIESKGHKELVLQVDELLETLRQERQERAGLNDRTAREQALRGEVGELRTLVESLQSQKAASSQRMAVVKQDYDILYAKYAKYKAIARGLRH